MKLVIKHFINQRTNFFEIFTNKSLSIKKKIVKKNYYNCAFNILSKCFKIFDNKI